jgi:hypothetical protein
LGEAPTLHVYPGTEAKEARTVLHLHHDDGYSRAYQNGERTLREVVLAVDATEVSCGIGELHSGYAHAPKSYPLVLHGENGHQRGELSPGTGSEVAWVRFGP